MTGYPGMEQQLQLEREMAMFSVDVAWSLTQPWATLMAIGAKGNETRGARGMPNFTGWVAIHASKGFPLGCRALTDREPFKTALQTPGTTTLEELPLGVVLAVARVVAVRRTEDVRDHISTQELAFGDYSDGRRAFITKDLRRLKQPFAARGMLGLWKLPRPITLEDLVDA